jgi:hypothetical protein
LEPISFTVPFTDYLKNGAKSGQTVKNCKNYFLRKHLKRKVLKKYARPCKSNSYNLKLARLPFRHERVTCLCEEGYYARLAAIGKEK